MPTREEQLEQLLSKVLTLYRRHKASVPKQVRGEFTQTLLTCVLHASKGRLGDVPKELREQLLPLLIEVEFGLRDLKEKEES